MDITAFRSDVDPFALEWEGETGDPVGFMNNKFLSYSDYEQVCSRVDSHKTPISALARYTVILSVRSLRVKWEECEKKAQNH